jgi:putative transcriptional regulator
MKEAEYLTGKLLLAMPGMGDPRFDHAVIAMCLHDHTGAFGIGVGQHRQGVRLRGLLKDVGINPGKAPDVPVMDGGPVEPGRGFVLHSADWSGDGTVEIEGLCSLTGTLDVLRAIARGDGPMRWLVSLGYAGWAAGQLDGEMRRHGWFAAPGRREILFGMDAPARWSAAWRSEGIDPASLANVTGSA